jgi:hypothetical protein
MELKALDPPPEALIVTPNPLFVNVTLVPAMRFRAPWVAFANPLVLNIEGKLPALMVPIIPVAGTDVAEIVPLPATPREAPVPTAMFAVVLVPDAKAEKFVDAVEEALIVTAPPLFDNVTFDPATKFRRL